MSDIPNKIWVDHDSDWFTRDEPRPDEDTFGLPPYYHIPTGYIEDMQLAVKDADTGLAYVLVCDLLAIIDQS